MDYQRRLIDGVLDELFEELPAILLDGPKAVGKTTTALQRCATEKRLDIPTDLARAVADSRWVVEETKPILIDEWQSAAPSWNEIKRAVDADNRGKQYLLTGSLPPQGTHSGAGRISALRMRPLAFAERDLEEPTVSFTALLEGNGEVRGETRWGYDGYLHEIERSGFPGLRNLSSRPRRAALDGYITRIVDSDVRELGRNLRKPASMLSWLTAYAAATATTAKWESIRVAASDGDSNSLSKPALIAFRDALTRLRILDELPTWVPSRNHFVRVGQSGKHFLADPALALRLLDQSTKHLYLDALPGPEQRDRPLVGRLFEALVALSVRTHAETNYGQAFHFRDARGLREIDIVVEREDGKLLPIEVKLGNVVTTADLRHLKWFKEQLGEAVIDLVVVYTGTYAYRMEGVAIVPLSLLGA